MCRRVQCKQCDRPTYAGCGMHVEQVLGGVKPEDRCQGHERSGGGFFAKLLGR